jgi:CRP-like cAMP-binding protein
MEGDARLTRIAAPGCETSLAFAPPIRDPLESLSCLAVSARYGRGQEIYAPDDPADHWYRIISGMARKCAVMADGRRQIVDFLRPGDFFGLITRPKHRFAVEAVVEGTVVARYPRRRVELLADSDSRIGRRIREAAFEAISRSQARMIILGRMSAQGRVGAFILEMAERSHDAVPGDVLLPMSRYDIGDYLALAAETVSRTLSDLRQSGAIRLEGTHRIRIVDRAALEEGDDRESWYGSELA